MATKVYSDDTAVNQPADIILKDGTLTTGGAIVEPTGNVLQGDYMAALAFMEETMEIIVQETADENAENPVTVGNGGTFAQFFRGVPTVTKRKFVDSLIVKTGRVSTPEYINGAGERARSIKQISAHKYPFMVVSDKNPRGTEWLKMRLAEYI